MTKKELRDQFYMQERIPMAQMQPNDVFTHYKLKTGQVIFETYIDSGLGGEEVEINMMNDMHINYISAEDEDDDEVMLTKKCRWFCANGASLRAVDGAMDVAQYADQTVLAGDTMDFLCKGNLEMVKKHIFDRDPSVLAPIGIHELGKNVQTGKHDRIPLEERFKIVQSHWIHDLLYETRDHKDKVICVAIDNSRSYYLKGVAARLQADVERARKENKIILMFQHEPLATGVPADAVSHPLYDAYRGDRNFYDGVSIFSKNKPMKPGDEEMYEVLKNGTDVIRGIFCGHYHSLFYHEIHFDTDEGVKTIPQYTCVGNTYFGMDGVVTRIIVR